ncbi:MAG: UDP-N-acetylglucosamine 1-carboxyvinyltransferase [Clostridia bacterium]|nr:UDP-N-acetylglucosamine 1-carboxyvinyltransferase [Clostridia bacterium]
MKKITVHGGARLVGRVNVSGSKNAALPVIFSCILTNGVNVIENLPDIGDVRVALEILCDMGAGITKRNGTVLIDTRELRYVEPRAELVASIRASTYLLGACLSRFGVCHILPFGGCNFASRPIDMHLQACTSLGCNINGGKVEAEHLRGAEIIFDKPSVGATVNAILLAASAEGDTEIIGCAVEPHIDCLIDFINSAGGMVVRQGNRIRISGRRLSGGNIRIIGDMIEAGSFLSASLITDGGVWVDGCSEVEMHSLFCCFRALGAEVVTVDGAVRVYSPKKENVFQLTTSPYPGFPTDLQPILAPIMARFAGGRITDTVWQTRFGYLDALSSFGIRSRVEGNSAEISPSKITSASVTAPDLRGGFACLLAALCATGKSEIYSAETLLRGYENLEKKLRSLGASIEISNI